MTQKPTSDLPPEESYVVTRLRQRGEPLRFNNDNRPHLSVGPESVCTFDTLFRMLGRGVLVLDPAAPRLDRYLLTEEWKE